MQRAVLLIHGIGDQRPEWAARIVVRLHQALFSLKYGGPEAFQRPITVETPQGRWINMLDPIDPIAMPLRGLNDAYAQAVWRDVQVNTGGGWDAHTRYFQHEKILALIARKLVLDWAAGRLDADALAAAEQDFMAACAGAKE